MPRIGTAFGYAIVVGKTMIYEFIRNTAINRWELIAGNPVPRP